MSCDLMLRAADARNAMWPGRTVPRTTPVSKLWLGRSATRCVTRSSLIPEPERRAVELAYFGGHSYRTVASMLDEPEGTVKSRIRSGLARLRSALADQDLQDA